MKSRWMRFSAVAATIISSHAGAAGFGEIRLQSHIGENLRADVPVYLTNPEAIDSACFSLAPLAGADLPVETSARLRLVRNDSGYRLMIVGNRPISEPLFMIGLRAQCGIDLQRDYVLMPEAPSSLAEAPAEAPPARPNSPLAQRTPPRSAQVADARADDRPAGAEASRPPVQKSAPKPPLRKAKAAGVAKAADHLVLGAPPSEVPAGKKQAAQWSTLGEMDERMLKLENSLQSLSQEVDKLNAALALATEALAAQQKLQEAQRQLAARPASTAGLAMAASVSPEAPSSRNNWLELLLGTLIGGAVAGGVASYLGRRKRRTIHSELPLAVSSRPLPPLSSEPPAVPVARNTPAPQPAPTTPAPTPVAAPATPEAAMSIAMVDIPLDTAPPTPFTAAAPAGLDETESVLDLAEIMLSFGRVRGAADALAEHIEASSPANIQPWLKLLDLYRRGNLRQEFEALATRIRGRFNVHVPSWDETRLPVSGIKSLSDYAHIIGRLPQIWGSQSCLDYLYNLISISRNGERTGFPIEVTEEIALLIRILENGYGLRRTA